MTCHAGGPIRTFAVGLLSFAAVAAGLLLLRQQKYSEAAPPAPIPAGEAVPATIVLERLRELGV